MTHKPLASQYLIHKAQSHPLSYLVTDVTRCTDKAPQAWVACQGQEPSVRQDQDGAMTCCSEAQRPSPGAMVGGDDKETEARWPSRNRGTSGCRPCGRRAGCGAGDVGGSGTRNRCEKCRNKRGAAGKPWRGARDPAGGGGRRPHKQPGRELGERQDGVQAGHAPGNKRGWKGARTRGRGSRGAAGALQPCRGWGT